MQTTPAITTVTKMLESLPEPAQDQVAEHLREYIEDMRDDQQWDAAFAKTQPGLVDAARRARAQRRRVLGSELS
ncbi:MAG: hypothetical protein K1X53_14130 [Candidatus Sumerlaeaceae bacterium]|nr:hypothetical protein [Candidatus Sumerlaeaceae bacterium]